jgi:hypothetical protein
MAIVPLSLSPFHHITYDNSSEFRNLLKWLRMSSLPKQETSYWPLMHDPCNVLEWPHERFLFGFALPTPMIPRTPPSWSLSGSLHPCTPRDMQLPPSLHTWPESLPSMPPWVFRLVSRDWNAPRFIPSTRTMSPRSSVSRPQEGPHPSHASQIQADLGHTKLP